MLDFRIYMLRGFKVKSEPILKHCLFIIKSFTSVAVVRLKSVLEEHTSD